MHHVYVVSTEAKVDTSAHVLNQVGFDVISFQPQSIGAIGVVCHVQVFSDQFRFEVSLLFSPGASC